MPRLAYHGPVFLRPSSHKYLKACWSKGAAMAACFTTLSWRYAIRRRAAALWEVRVFGGEKACDFMIEEKSVHASAYVTRRTKKVRWKQRAFTFYSLYLRSKMAVVRVRILRRVSFQPPAACNNTMPTGRAWNFKNVSILVALKIPHFYLIYAILFSSDIDSFSALSMTSSICSNNM